MNSHRPGNTEIVFRGQADGRLIRVPPTRCRALVWMLMVCFSVLRQQNLTPFGNLSTRPSARISTHVPSLYTSRLRRLTPYAPRCFSCLAKAIPGGPERRHRAGVESTVSSSHFRLRGLAPWAHASPGAAYSAVEWDADRNLLAVGTISGALGVMTTGLESASGGGGDRSRRRFAPWRSGARPEEERVCWATAASGASGQVGGDVVLVYCRLRGGGGGRGLR